MEKKREKEKVSDKNFFLFCFYFDICILFWCSAQELIKALTKHKLEQMNEFIMGIAKCIIIFALIFYMRKAGCLNSQKKSIRIDLKMYINICLQAKNVTQLD